MSESPEENWAVYFRATGEVGWSVLESGLSYSQAAATVTRSRKGSGDYMITQNPPRW